MTGRTDDARLDEALERRLAALAPERRALVLRLLARDDEEDQDELPGLSRRPAQLTDIPASFEQERLWFMNELLTHREIFHVPTALRLRGPLDTGALRGALTRVTARHEGLRTVLRPGPDGPRQVVLETMDTPLAVEDCRTAADPERAARERASAALAEPFDLATGPLLRCRLYRLGDEDHLLLIVQHHIVSDYWSLGILLADLGEAYAVERGAPDRSEPLELHYPDFAYWQRRTLDGDRLKRQLDYWREQLADPPGVLHLPADRPRPAVRGSRGSFHRVEFPPGPVAGLRRLARENDTTLNVAFLACYSAALARFTRQDDLVVGVPVAGRLGAAQQRMVGYFLNWLPVRVRLDGRPSLRELIRRTRDAFTGALAHQDLPFDMLVRELQPDRAPGVTPVFQTSFSLRDSAPTPPRLPGLDVQFADLDGGATHFDLMAELWCEDDRVVGYLPYDDELFDPETVAALARWTTRLLTAAAADPDRPLAAVPLLDAAERAAVTRGPDPAAQHVTGTLHARFAAQAARRPDAVAVSDEHGGLTYRELEQRAGRLARVLRSRGVGPGSVVALLTDRTHDLVTAVLGVLASGAAYLPVDPDNPAERTARQLADCAVPLVVHSPHLAGRLPGSAPDALALDWTAAPLADAPATWPATDTGPGDPAYVIHTSGSTGAPKGVVVTHGNVLRLFAAAEPEFAPGPDDVWTLFHSYAFDFSVWELWGALLYGGRLVVVPQWTSRAPDAFLDLLDHAGVTVLSQTPSAFHQLAAVAVAAGRLPAALRTVVFGGEALDPAALADWFAAFGDRRPRLVNMYGITETTVHVTVRPVTAADTARAASPIGGPLPHLSLYLLDDELQPVPDGLPGEIFVGGGGVALRYQGAPALTAARMLPDPYSPVPGARMYRSGDLAVRRRDGELVHLGRTDQQHKIRGHRIELGEVRAALLRLDGVAAGAVFVTDDRRRGKTLLACAVPAEGAGLTPTRVRRALLRTLPEWMVPATVLVVPELPLTRNGKLDERALLALRREEERAHEPVTPPRGPTAEALAAIWAELLDTGGRGIGAEDNFFELGGHSLMVVQLVSRIHTELGAQIPMETLFLRPGLQEMADALDEAGRAPRAGIDVPDADWLGTLSEAEIDAMLAALDDDQH
ncbi:amino acid adenylation domain-containing protein [Streptomyces sp. NPDC017405]|uniref:amino acid adenylation domain-containing protein n=1 Tax=unclassified Streptomyces TaxID=2593676 RepID=UPI0037A2698A